LRIDADSFVQLVDRGVDFFGVDRTRLSGLFDERLRVSDNGELEVPYIGMVPAEGKTCKELANNIKAALEREYYYHATVILALDRVSEKSRGRVYVYGAVKGQGPQEIPPDESYTVSKAIIKAGGFGDFASDVAGNNNARRTNVETRVVCGFAADP